MFMTAYYCLHHNVTMELHIYIIETLQKIHTVMSRALRCKTET